MPYQSANAPAIPTYRECEQKIRHGFVVSVAKEDHAKGFIDLGVTGP